MSMTLTPGRTAYLTVTDDTEKGFTIKKMDGQNKASLQGTVFRFEQINGCAMNAQVIAEGDRGPAPGHLRKQNQGIRLKR